MDCVNFIQNHVKSGNTVGAVRLGAKSVKCADGFQVSVQASEFHYCTPRDNEGPYSTFELGFPSAAEDLIAEYAEDASDLTGTVYSQVPLDVVVAVLVKHGGVNLQPDV